ncbi:MAG TPA: hypothetical protein VHG51_21745 [Longimicrobiaceae bacterium]|nr:hypothetical protein [Longimicrobiaceae bacterium]
MNRVDFSSRLLLLAAVVPLPFAACSAGPGEPRWRGTVQRDGAAVEVVNPGAPVFGAEAASASLAWEVPPPADGEPGAWSKPSSLALGAGEIYVLDPVAHTVHVLSRSGKPLRDVGRAGRGPGELGYTFGVASVDGLLAVGNAGAGRVELFAASGEPAGSVALGTPAFTLAAVPPGGLLVWNARAEQRLYDVRGESRAIPLAPFTGAERAGKADCVRLAGAVDRILQLDCTTPVFHVVARDGTRMRTVRVRRKPVPASAEELGQYRSTIAAAMARDERMTPTLARSLLEDMTRKQSPKRLMRGIRHDPASGLYALWEQQPRELGTGPARLHLFSPTGVFLATVGFAGPWLDFEIDDLTVYALTEDPETGLAGLSAYRVSLAPEVRALASAAPEDL